MALPNPSMSFSPFAILTAEEMNDLVENITSLSDGTGIADGAITTDTLAESAVIGDKLDFTTLTLADVKATSGFSTTGGATLVTGLTSGALTLKTGDKIKITVSVSKMYNATGASNSKLSLWDGTVGSGMQIGEASVTSAGANYGAPASIIVTDSPTAGSHTYNVGLQNQGGTNAVIDMSSTSPASLIVERIG